MRKGVYIVFGLLAAVLFGLISLQKDIPEPVYIVDGQEMTISEMDKKGIVVKHIEKYVGDKAIKKFGEKGKNGVMVISTK